MENFLPTLSSSKSLLRVIVKFLYHNLEIRPVFRLEALHNGKIFGLMKHASGLGGSVDEVNGIGAPDQTW